jgi:esterase
LRSCSLFPGHPETRAPQSHEVGYYHRIRMAFARFSFTHAGLTFSYLDSGPARRILIALHGHLMEAATFTPLAAALAPDWRILALDQRGHGHTSHAVTYTRADYLGDLEAFFAHLHLPHAVLLGSSLGGVNAYQFAARHPQQVSALIIEDIGATVSDDISFIASWAGVYPTREALLAQVGNRFAPYIADSVRETTAGWRLAFDPADMLVSQSHLHGDHWTDWLATTCPALLIRGGESRVTQPEELAQMAKRRPNTALLTLPGGHILHDQPAFTAALRTFLASR